MAWPHLCRIGLRQMCWQPEKHEEISRSVRGIPVRAWMTALDPMMSELVMKSLLMKKRYRNICTQMAKL